MTDAKLTAQGLNTEILHDLLSQGVKRKDMAVGLGISVTQLNRTIKELQEGQGLLLKYRELQALQLTSLQARVLEAITPEKIEAATLSELVGAFRILKDKENCELGKPTEIKGLVGYLVEMEKQELANKNAPIDITPTKQDEEIYEEDLEENDLPNL